ncbi:hypothetical protein ABFS83_03G018300 [Erythranthe nasuta]
MFSYHTPHRFLKKIKPLLGQVLTKGFTSLKTTKHRKPINYISPKIKKPHTKKNDNNPEPKIYSREKITKIYNILKYSTWDSAQEQLEMKAKGCRPTVVSYTAYMKILFGRKKVDEAADVYKEMLESGVKPNCYTYTVLMEYLASSGKFDEALEIFDKMQEASVQPDKAACNILIEISCKTGETRAMTKILDYMKDNFFVLRYRIYQKALEAFKIAGESDMLLRQVNRHFSAEKNLNDEPEKYDLDNDFALENSLVLNLLNKRSLVGVDSLLSDMAEKGVRLESGVVSKVIEVNSACQRQNGALLAYEYSVKSGINIERTAYLALIGLYVRINSFPKVVEIFEKIAMQGFSLSTHLNSTLI